MASERYLSPLGKRSLGSPLKSFSVRWHTRLATRFVRHMTDLRCWKRDEDSWLLGVTLFSLRD